MSLYSRFKTDRSLEENGVWVDFGDGIKVKVARFNSERSRAVRRRLEAPFRSVLRTGSTLPEKTATEITTKQMAEAIVLDWEGVTGEDGVTILPATLENKIKVLTDLPDFRESVAQAALEASTFKAVEDGETSKN